jgi:predicted MFS family arabinose efflux permease
LPRVHAAIAIGVFGVLMVANVGRMVAAMAMITAGVEPQRRGGFMSANSTVQHVAAGLGASIGGLVITQAPGQPIERFPLVGALAALSTLLSLWLAGRLRTSEAAEAEPIPAEPLSLAAAAEATCESGEWIAGIVESKLWK